MDYELLVPTEETNNQLSTRKVASYSGLSNFIQQLLKRNKNKLEDKYLRATGQIFTNRKHTSLINDELTTDNLRLMNGHYFLNVGLEI